jgi:beta-lactamase class C
MRLALIALTAALIAAPGTSARADEPASGEWPARALIKWPRWSLASLASAARAESDVARVVARHVKTILAPGEPGGAGVAVRIDGRTLFYDFGLADVAGKRPITADSLFNLASLRKVFEATLLAQAVRKGDLALDDPAAKYVTELQRGGDIRHVTLGQLATHTSGLLLPQDHPPWPDWGYTLPQFIRTLNAWQADFEIGKPTVYTHAGYILLQLALERRYGVPIDEMIEQRITQPLGMASTTLPLRDDSPRGRLSPEHKARAVQGYGYDGRTVGEPGDQQGYYYWPGTSQMYSSPRDMALLVAANLGELPVEPSLREGMQLARQGVLTIGPRTQQALAWEIVFENERPIVEKYGGLNNASAYVGMMPGRKLGIVILGNRGNQYPSEAGRRILRELAGP